LLKKILSAILLLSLLISSCKEEKPDEPVLNNKVFSWKQELKISEIPDTPVKGFLNGKDIEITYVNFENWRGSGDNVLNFSNVKPKNNCGFIENNNSFQLLKKAGEIKAGELIKATFDQNLDGYTAFYEIRDSSGTEVKSTEQWNCALVITFMDEKTVKGKIAICFKDESKSWIAGTFEANRCYN